MIWMDNSTGRPRMGLIVPKFQSSAVARNRLRRRLREIWRREVQQHQPAFGFTYKGDVTCFVIDRVNHRAWVGGVRLDWSSPDWG